MQKKSIFLIVLFVLSIIAPTTAQIHTPTTYYVSTNGSNDNNGLDWKNALQTIHKGVDLAKPGDTIMVAKGTYDESMDIYYSIKIIGVNKPIIQGKKTSDHSGNQLCFWWVYGASLENFVLIDTNIENLDLLTIKDCEFTGRDDPYYGGSEINNRGNCHLINCYFHDNYQDLIHTYTSRSSFDAWDGYMYLTHCTFEKNEESIFHGDGVVIWDEYTKNHTKTDKPLCESDKIKLYLEKKVPKYIKENYPFFKK